MEIEIGKGKTGRRSYGFDEVSIVPSRRTRDPEDIDISVNIGEYKLELPVLASAMDGVVDVRFAIEMRKVGGLAVLNLEGLQCRYDNADEILERISKFSAGEATRKMQKIYSKPIKEELIAKRVKQIKKESDIACASLTPKNVEKYYNIAIDAGLDILVIQGTVVSAEHVSKTKMPLDLKKFIPECPVPVIAGGCASYSTSLHLMRTGAVGVLIGVGPGAACTTRQVLGIGVPQATAIADASAARVRHLEETGQYSLVIADGGMRTGGDIAKAIACGADLVMIGFPLSRAKEAPGRGYHWGMATFHPDLPRGTRIKTDVVASLREILVGPAFENDGTLNLFGALRTSMATCGYENIKDFQKAEVMVAPSIKTEGKLHQQQQRVGMGS
ncbi:MAG: GuaB3 family IMP dehydrogenase-related protein [Actinobacteria bacterium]|nr:MAG: GuaB3 family IMP dehydrogenase-related protein [Actinomycetota bacterium]